MANRGSSLPGSVWNAVMLILVVAAGARAAYELLAPLVPSLLVLVGLLGVFVLIFRRR